MQGFGHAGATFSQESPEFGQEAFLGIDVSPAILRETHHKRDEPQRQLMESEYLVNE